MISIEWHNKNGRLEIHTDPEGVQQLVELLNKLAQAKGDDHLHLMTEKWGGSGLSEKAQSSESELINHVKIFLWRTADRTKTSK